LTLPYTLGEVKESAGASGVPRYNAGMTADGRIAPSWAGGERFFLGSDVLGRSLLIRMLTGGGVSLLVGFAAAIISVTIGTFYGALSGYIGGRVDSILMRIVDVLYGLPYILLVVLLAVASDAVVGEYVSRQRERAEWTMEQARAELRAQSTSNSLSISDSLARERLAQDPALRSAIEARALQAVPPRAISTTARTFLDLSTLLIAIGGVSWLTMARVVRGQVLSLRNQPFVEAARVMGFSRRRIILRHILPNLTGTIIVYATLIVPQAILQESFLSFLGIGVKPPLPSWGTLVAEGLQEINPYKSHWWLIVFPCAVLGVTLLCLNFVGEGLREAFDVKSASQRKDPGA
jgi:ABC-type dipeptide/oligopeptide/nickel transport system permease subunit